MTAIEIFKTIALVAGILIAPFIIAALVCVLVVALGLIKSRGAAEAAGSRRQTTANTQRRRLYGHTRRLRRRVTIRLKSSAAAESEE